MDPKNKKRPVVPIFESPQNLVDQQKFNLSSNQNQHAITTKMTSPEIKIITNNHEDLIINNEGRSQDSKNSRSNINIAMRERLSNNSRYSEKKN